MRVLLLTGFEPFGGEKVNPSLVAAQQLDGYRTGDIVVKSLAIPVSWEQVPLLLEQALGDHSPSFVISVGQAGNRAKMAVERIGVNICFGNDNYDVSRGGERIVDEASDAYFSSLPVGDIADAINGVGVPAYVSDSAGTYLCNYTLFLLEHLIRQRGLPIAAGFIHIPYLPEQTTDKPQHLTPSMSLDTVVTGLRAAIDCLMSHSSVPLRHSSVPLRHSPDERGSDY